MKKLNVFLLLYVIITLGLLSCKKTELDPFPHGDNPSNKCQIATTKSHLLLAGTISHPKKWTVRYKDSLGTRITVPGLISPTLDNTLYFQPNDSLYEYNSEGAIMDIGKWRLSNCGNTIILNTTLSGKDLPFVLIDMKQNYFSGYFYIPVGPGGSIIKVILEGDLVNGK